MYIVLRGKTAVVRCYVSVVYFQKQCYCIQAISESSFLYRFDITYRDCKINLLLEVTSVATYHLREIEAFHFSSVLKNIILHVLHEFYFKFPAVYTRSLNIELSYIHLLVSRKMTNHTLQQ